MTHQRVGDIPVSLFRMAEPSSGPMPAVVIAHGFAGSRQLMQPFAVTMARNGYAALTFDFPGHGRHPAPMPGNIADVDMRHGALDEALDQVVAFAQGLAETDGRLALIGHSMGGDVVVRHARAHPAVAATVGVSPYLSDIAAEGPGNFLVIYGALEPAHLLDQGYALLRQVADDPVAERETYGSVADGTARRLVLADGVEHIGVLYSGQSLDEALTWLDRVFAQQGDGFVDRRGPWLGLLFLGVIALAWPLVRLLPQASSNFVGAGLPWRRLLPFAVAPALLTPLILWQLPTDFLPLLLGDYLVLHFGLYGLLTALGLWLSVRTREPGPGGRTDMAKLAVLTAAAVAYGVAAIALPTDRFVTAFVPGAERWPLVLAMLVGTTVYFCADEWLTRGPGAPRGAYAVTKLCFLVSLGLAIALNLHELFFLIIIIPMILAFFVIYGLFSAWIYRRCRHPLAGALVSAVAFAIAIAVTFPTVAR